MDFRKYANFSSELNGRVIVILILGPSGAGKTNVVKLITGQDIRIGHQIESGTCFYIPRPSYLLTEPFAGTLDAMCIFTDVNGQLFLFIDTPGFGHPDFKTQKVKNNIYALVGYFTRQLGGIHGVLYFQNILIDKYDSGMVDSLEFLEKILDKERQSRITFITTKWDLVVNKQRTIREDRAEELKDKTWKKFKIGQPNGHWYFASGVDCDRDSEEDKRRQRDRLVNEVLSRYIGTKPQKLEMPFGEWTWGDQAVGVAKGLLIAVTSPLWLPSFIIYSLTGIETRFSVSFSA